MCLTPSYNTIDLPGEEGAACRTSVGTDVTEIILRRGPPLLLLLLRLRSGGGGGSGGGGRGGCCLACLACCRGRRLCAAEGQLRARAAAVRPAVTKRLACVRRSPKSLMFNKQARDTQKRTTQVAKTGSGHAEKNSTGLHKLLATMRFPSIGKNRSIFIRERLCLDLFLPINGKRTIGSC